MVNMLSWKILKMYTEILGQFTYTKYNNLKFFHPCQNVATINLSSLDIKPLRRHISFKMNDHYLVSDITVTDMSRLPSLMNI